MIDYKNRNEIPEEYTWDLSSLYKNDEEFLLRLESLDKDIEKLQKYKGKLLESKDNLLNALRINDDVSRKIHNLYCYSHLKSDLDTTDALYQDYHSRVKNSLTKVLQATSYFEVEILKADKKQVDEYLKDEKLKLYTHYFDNLFRNKEHILTDKEEKLIATVSELFSTSSTVFSMLNNADFKFLDVDSAEGKKPLTHGNYILYLQDKNRELRKDAFEKMYKTYIDHINTLSITLSQEVKKHVVLSRVRGFDSAREMALNKNNISEKIYDTLIEKVDKYLPYMKRYLEIRKKVLKVDKLHMYDVYVPLVEDFEYKVTYEEAKEIVLKSLAPMGEEYTNKIQEAFDNRWIDVYENPGKRSGAYSSGTYDSYPYILLNYQNNVNNMFTLTHELGHSMHTYYTKNNQEYIYGDYSIFLAEIASTFNESLLNHYLLKTEKDKKKRLYLINNFIESIKGTIFRQTMFAEFERNIHALSEKGIILTSNVLNEEYLKLNKKHFEDVYMDDEIKYEWSRIPHFYYNFYVYQYATGLSSALSLSKRVLDEEEGAIKKYYEFLKAGSSKYPVDVLKLAGVDIEKGDVIEEALEIFKDLVLEFEELILGETNE